jgi:hypothetical protein
MKFRNLRIAWSVTWGIAVVLLLVLWIRSNRHYESIARNNGKGVTTILCSTGGTVHFVRDLMMNRFPYSGYYTPSRSGTWEIIRADVVYPSAPIQWAGGLPFSWESKFVIPHWFLVALFAIAAGLPWIRHTNCRFSLRTLLIATTLVAVALGAIVYAIRQFPTIDRCRPAVISED